VTRLAVALVALLVGANGCLLVAANPFEAGDKRFEEKTLEGHGRGRVLLVELSGVITDQPTRRAFGLVEEESTLGRISAELDRAGDDSRVRAVVLHVDSPGGGVTASDEIYAELRRFRAEHPMPVVASLGDVAASGGYYVACAADTIVAHPTTVTGSIGVILTSLNLEGLMAKIGVRNATYKAGAHKDILSPLRAATPEERRIVQGILDSLHARFVQVVRDGRPRIDAARLPQLTDGRIFGAQQALDAGLVDQIGSLRDALAVAKRAAGLPDDARVVTYLRPSESRETIHATGGAPAQVNVLPVDLGLPGATGPRFEYLWAPGLGD
jgi:protease-4